MSDLLTDTGAVFSKDRTRRLHLWRIWETDKPALIMVMMNPSIATEVDNDPTVERCQRRALKMGFGGLHVFNIMDVIETDSSKLKTKTIDELCSFDNKWELNHALTIAKSCLGTVVCAWGKPGQKHGPVEWFKKEAEDLGVPLYALKINADGSPKHPLYVGYDAELVWFGGGEE